MFFLGPDQAAIMERNVEQRCAVKAQCIFIRYTNPRAKLHFTAVAFVKSSMISVTTFLTLIDKFMFYFFQRKYKNYPQESSERHQPL